MLPGVAREDDPTAIRLNQFQEFEHLLCADLTGLIHQHDRAAWHSLPCQKFTNRLRFLKSRFGQINRLLALRSHDQNGMSGFSNPLINRLQSKTLSCASATSKQGDEVSGV